MLQKATRKLHLVWSFIINPRRGGLFSLCTNITEPKAKCNIDPVSPGKHQPVDPKDAEGNKGKSYTCTFSIVCSFILNNLDMLDPDKVGMVPSWWFDYEKNHGDLL